MTQERIDLLNNLGFEWIVRGISWDRQLNNFKSFREEYGHSNVPANHPKYPKLHVWINFQRYQYSRMKRGKKSLLTPARVKVLDSIGFCWDVQEAKWWLHRQELVDFKEKYGHFAIPTNSKLQLWVSNQSSVERIRALTDIGFKWTAEHK
jgi:hypothetical protein